MKYKIKKCVLALKLTKEFLLEEYSLDRKNKSAQIIGDECGRSKSVIYYYLNKYKIKIKTQSEAMNGKKRKAHTEETKQKISESKIGSKNPMYGKCGESNPNWQGGKTKDKTGYILIYSPNHPYKVQNKIRENRLVVESQIGRYLLLTEVVHHINCIKSDNRPENLICFTSNSAHTRFHKDPNNVKPEEIIFDGRKLKRR